ncbi:MAG: Mrp/NBP35 family ATP-binding protein [Anaerolineaceae bacterium]|jgi:ATP-binding protein involved in chromosome partitioning|nr:Mrp/NBP35 family ATP-binding protein [Anaerolineaceae bacterium]
MTSVTNENILDALRTVMDPELHKDLVTLKMIKDVEVSDGAVSFSIELTTPACPLRTKIESDARRAVEAVPGVKSVEIKMTAKVRSDGKERELLKSPMQNVIAIASGKGGVGKSTVAVNLAISLAQSGATVGLLDADIYGPNVPTMMGVNHLPPSGENGISPAVAYGVRVMSIGFMVKPDQPLIWRGPMLHSAIQQFLRDVEWGCLDYLVVDLPPGTGDVQLSIAQFLPVSGGLIVTLPQQVSLEDANRGLHMFNKLEIPILGVVENMSYLELPDGTRMEVFGAGGGEKLAAAAGVPFIGKIPMDPDVRAGGDDGVPIVVSNPDAASAKALKGIAEDVAARLSVALHESGK